MILLIFSTVEGQPHVIKEVQDDKARELLAHQKAMCATPGVRRRFKGQYRDLTTSPLS